MARIDDYKESFRLASLELKKRDPEPLAKLAGAAYSAATGIVVPYLGVNYIVKIHPETDISKEGSTDEVSLPDKILIAHYLLGASGKKPTGNLITFRQVPDGHFYFDAFQRRARDPFLGFFGTKGKLFVEVASKLGARKVENGDFGMEFQVFPKISLQLVLWKGDDEFPPDATILFDETIQSHLPAEDIAVMSGSLVYRLMGMGAKALQEGAAR